MEYLLVLRQRGTAVSNNLKYYKCFAKLWLFQSILFGSIEQGIPSVALLSLASITTLLTAEPISLLRLLISNIQPKSSQNCFVLLLLSFSLYLSCFLICLLFVLMFLLICFLCFCFHILINFLVLDIDPSITFYFFVEFTIIFTCFTSCIPYGIFVNWDNTWNSTRWVSTIIIELDRSFLMSTSHHLWYNGGGTLLYVEWKYSIHWIRSI